MNNRITHSNLMKVVLPDGTLLEFVANGDKWPLWYGETALDHYVKRYGPGVQIIPCDDRDRFATPAQ